MMLAMDTVEREQGNESINSDHSDLIIGRFYGFFFRIGVMVMDWNSIKSMMI